MSRGNRWEATYDPSWDGPSEELFLTEVKPGITIEGKCLVGPPDKRAKVRWHDKDLTRIFERCDFRLPVEGDFVTKCVFRLCRFKGSAWQNVRFSKCIFENCDFSEVEFKHCYFVGTCEFRGNTASGETFRMEETSISASAFIEGLAPNLTHEKPERIGYSQYKFVKTRAKIASVIYGATRNEADFEFYVQAYEQFTRCTLSERVERHRYNESTQQKNTGFWWRSFLDKIDSAVIIGSGSLSDWGRSISKPLLWFVIIVALFTIYYAVAAGVCSICSWHEFRKTMITALNITLVAGYTAEFKKTLPWLVQLGMIVNVVLGLLWYSLIIPVLTRRILR